MLTEQNHLPVNWIDGMKISRRHFQETEFFITDQVMDSNALFINRFNFGILPGEKSFVLDVQCDFSQQISAEVKYCNAVTPNGARIFITPSNSLKITTNFKEIATTYSLQTSQPQTLFVLLSVNPFSRVPHGQPYMDENPPRHPFTLPEIHIDILPSEQIKTQQLASILLIGKIDYYNGELHHQKEYIPACTLVESLPVVADWHQKFQHQLETLEHCASRIIEKIRAKGHSNGLTNGIMQVSEKILFQQANNRTYYKWVLPSAPPIYLCEILMRLLQHLHSTLQILSPADREEVINYFTEWTDIQQGGIDRQVAQVLQMNYNHNNLHHIFTEIAQAYNMYVQIFEKMVQLEYIGKHKGDSKIFIEQKVDIVEKRAPQPEKAARWSPLD